MYAKLTVIVLLHLLTRTNTADNSSVPIRLCVIREKLEFCKQLQTFSSEHNVGLITCVPARDRVECMHKLKDQAANLVHLAANEAYAAHSNFKLVPLLEEKTGTGEFMYEGVAVVQSGQGIKTLHDLKRASSCHTGYGRTAGWDIPVALLFAENVFDENKCGDEFGAVSGFFKKSCLPGSWSNDPDENRRLKLRYPNLCEMCNNTCNYTTTEADRYLGYTGALQCLEEKHADIAFTKLSVVREYASTKPDFAQKYKLLCRNGTVAPLSADDCFWAARPNPLLVVHESLSVNDRDSLRKQMRALLAAGGSQRPAYFAGTILSNVSSVDFVNVTENIKTYLEKADFSITMDKPSTKCQEKYARVCVISDLAKSKCNDLKVAAFSQRLRPLIDCIQVSSEEDCLKSIEKKNSDVTVVGAGSTYRGSTHYSLAPMMSEIYTPPRDFSYYAVAVIRLNSSVAIKALTDLKGKKTCNSHYMCSAGWRVPTGVLASKGLISGSGCELTSKMEGFFSGGCVPTAPSSSSLCSQCRGDANGTNKCTNKDLYFGHKGAFRCLVESAGDVAFIHHSTVLELVDQPANPERGWTNNLKSDDYRLLCPSNEVKNVSEYKTCNWAKLPGKQVLISSTVGTYSDKENNLRLMLIRASSFFGPNSTVFSMFGEYNNVSSVIFTNGTIRLGPNADNATGKSILGDDLHKFLQVSDCNSAASSTTFTSSTVASLVVAFFYLVRFVTTET